MCVAMLSPPCPAAERASRRREEDAAAAASLLTSPNLAASASALFTRATAEYVLEVRRVAATPPSVRLPPPRSHFPPSLCATG